MFFTLAPQVKSSNLSSGFVNQSNSYLRIHSRILPDILGHKFLACGIVCLTLVIDVYSAIKSSGTTGPCLKNESQLLVVGESMRSVPFTRTVTCVTPSGKCASAGSSTIWELLWFIILQIVIHTSVRLITKAYTDIGISV
jgi:hypothetical protein